MSDNPFAPPQGEPWPTDLEAVHPAGIRGEDRIGWRGEAFFCQRAGRVTCLDRRAVGESAEIRMVMGGRVHLAITRPAAIVLPLERDVFAAFRRWLGAADVDLRRRSLSSGAVSEIVVGCIFASAVFLGEPERRIGDAIVGVSFIAAGLLARLRPSPLGKQALAVSWLVLTTRVLHDVLVHGGAPWQLVLVPIGVLAIVRHWRVAQFFKDP